MYKIGGLYACHHVACTHATNGRRGARSFFPRGGMRKCEYEGAGKPAARHAQFCECVGFLRIVVCAAGGQVRGVSRHACREFLCSRLQGWALHAETLCVRVVSSAIYSISIAALREASPTKPHHRPPTHRPVMRATSSASRTPASEAGTRPKAVPTCRWCDVEHGDGPTQRVEWAEYADTEATASPKGRWCGVCARVVVSYGPTYNRNLVLQRKGDTAFVEGFSRRTVARRAFSVAVTLNFYAKAESAWKMYSKQIEIR